MRKSGNYAVAMQKRSSTILSSRKAGSLIMATQITQPRAYELPRCDYGCNCRHCLPPGLPDSLLDLQMSAERKV